MSYRGRALEPGERAIFEAECVARAKDFDLKALLILLEYHGYAREQIWLLSRQGADTTRHIVHGIRFAEVDGQRRVEVDIETGLLRPDSPLPAHLINLGDDADVEEEDWLNFLHFFDHLLTAPTEFPVSGEDDPPFDAAVDLTCPLVARYVFQQFFPELGVRVESCPLERWVEAEAVTVGSSAVGSAAAVGGMASFPVAGYRVHFYCEDGQSSSGEYWPKYVERVLSSGLRRQFSESQIELTVTVHMPGDESMLRVGSHLAFEATADESGGLITVGVPG